MYTCMLTTCSYYTKFTCYPKDANDHKGNELKEVPLVAVVGIEENEVIGEVRIHELEGEGSCQRCKKCPPHHFMREVVRHLCPIRRV